MLGCGVVQILFMNSTRIEPPLASTPRVDHNLCGRLKVPENFHDSHLRYRIRLRKEFFLDPMSDLSKFIDPLWHIKNV
jgi:hypothetical protein